ncbi:hypothetical protein A5320_03900 [Rheinheimera sp. SA_1]|nr:hypothetical protein A5320_03900 [Rheinheimera sp. SA_1]
MLVEQGVDLVLEQGRLKAKAKKGALTAELSAQIGKHKQQLIAYLQHNENQQILPASRLPKIVPVAAQTEFWPLSYAQQRLWFIDQMNGSSAEYNMPLAFRISGAFDLSVADRVLTEIVRRHQILRTCYVEIDGVPYQQVRPETGVCIHKVVVPVGTSDTESTVLQQLMAAESAVAFDLSADVLIRACYFELAGATESNAVILFVLHHIAADGWSLEILRHEFCQLYQAYQHGLPANLAPVILQYKDYACWQREHFSGPLLVREQAYWQQQLADLPLTHNLPLLTDRPLQKQTVGALLTDQLDAASARVLLNIAAHFQLTPFMFLHAVLALVLARHSNHNDIVVGIPVANRQQVELSDLIGFFTSTLVLRLNTKSRSFSQYLAEVRQCHLEAQNHQHLPFDMLVEQLQVERSTAYTPLFQIMLTTGNQFHLTHETAVSSLSDSGLVFSLADSGIPPVKFDISIDLNLHEHGGSCQWLYDVSLFSHIQIANMQAHLKNLLQQLVIMAENGITALGERPLATLPMLPETEYQDLVVHRNSTSVDFQLRQPVHQWFAARAQDQPDRIALSLAEQQVTYRQLDEHSNQLAQYLRENYQLGTGQLAVVGIARSIELVVGMLAVMKTGAAYLLLDPEQGEQRLSDILLDATPTLVLTAKPCVFDRLTDKAPVVNISAMWPTIQRYSSTPLPVAQRDTSLSSADDLDQLAYLIYTSGSTGLPKGVNITHRSLADYCTFAMQYYYSPHCEGAWLLTSPYFDISVPALLLPLITGGRLDLLATEHPLEVLAGQLLAGSEQRFLLRLTPSHLQALLQLLPERPFSHQIVFVIGGEVLSVTAADALAERFPHSQIYNHYGPSEATVGCAIFDYSLHRRPDRQKVPIGRAMANTALLVLSDDLALLPDGAVGELYIGGAGLARGYRNNPTATALHFVEHPFAELLSTIGRYLYKTGDLVRYNQDGDLEFVGRVDQQLKFRGFRLEPAEIELKINRHPAIHSCLVLIDTSASGYQQLIAYVRLQHDVANTDISELLKMFLRPQLADYMLPEQFVVLQQWPLSANGKIDRKRLPAVVRSLSAIESRPLSTPQETLLADLWQQLLHIQKVGPDDRFFALGGHSLLAVSLLSRLEKSGYRISLKDVYRAGTLAEMALALIPVSTSADSEPLTATALIPPGCQQLKPAMLAFVQLEQSELDWLTQQVPGGAANIQDIYPLLSLQTGILFHHLLDAEHDPYRQSSQLLLHSAQAVNELIAAINFVISRHDLLRCCVISELEEPVAVILRQAEIPVFNFELQSTDDISALLQLRSATRLTRLDQAPLLNLDIGHDRSSGKYHAILTFHHMIIDHVGLDILMKEIALHRSGQIDRVPKPLPYRNFVADLLSRSRKINSAEFFADMLAGFKEPVVPFSIDDVQGNTAVVETVFQLPEPLAGEIRRLVAELNVSPASFFHTAFALMLQHLTGRTDVVFATVLSGRQQGLVGREHSVGMFLNSLPVRIRLTGSSVQATMQQVQHNLVALLEHEQCPLSVAIAASNVDPGRPLFTSVLNYRHSNISQAADIAAMTDIELIRTVERTNYPLSLGVTDVTGETGQMFHLSLKLHPSMDQQTVLSVLNGCVNSLATKLAEQPDLPIAQLLEPSEPSADQLLAACLTAEVSTTEPAHLAALFQQTVGQIPDALALCVGERQLSYAELAVLVMQTALHLQEQGIGRGDKVALCLNRGIDMVVAMLATLQTGACYVPLEPDWPAARLRFILQDASVRLVITEADVIKAQPWLVEHRLYLAGKPDLTPPPLTFETVAIEPTDLAYIIYTSGTTGQPKGVLISHGNVLSFRRGFACQLAELGLSAQDIWLWNASYAFDASIKALVSLLSGRPVVLTGHAQNKDAAALVTLLCKHRINVFNSVPAMVEQVAGLLLEHGVRTVHLISSGEDIPPRVWQRLIEYSKQTGCKALNAYGPTETTVNACYGLITLQHGVHMGRPLPDCQCYILDEQQQPVPQGTIGELYIGGANVALGYLNRLEQTAASFIPSPFATDSGQKLYKTGDLVKLSEMGNLVFCGRVDHQVKIRGYRIELEEIERTLLAADPTITQAVVLVQENKSGSKSLFGYVQSEAALEQTLLRQHLLSVLPEYMVPEQLSVLTALPMLSSGKIDRAALLVPLSQPQDNKTLPRNDTEAVLCEIWQKILQLDSVGIHDDFFLLGGDSILSMQVVAHARRKQLQVSIRQLLSARTIAALAEQIRDPAGQISLQRQVRGEQVLLPVQRQFFADLSDNGQHFNQSLFVQLPAGWAATAIQQFVNKLISRHDVFRLAFNKAETGRWQGRYVRAAGKEADYFKVVKMDTLAAEQHAQTIVQYANEAHASFDLAVGCLLRVIFFDYGPEQEGRLLLIAHHLVVDGVSWRIIAADLEFWLQQPPSAEVSLPAKTASYQDWARFLQAYTGSEAFRSEFAYWQELSEQINEQLPALPVTKAGHSALPDWQSCRFSLSATDTNYLLNVVPRIWDCDINEILLSALMLAWQQWQGKTALSLLMEGHGREVLDGAPDISESVGWFTSKYPLLLSSTETEPARVIQAVKQQYRAVPSKGIGYGLARYIAEPSLPNGLNTESMLQFNYLGSFDASFSGDTALKLATEHSGDAVAASYVPKHAMNLTSMVWQRKLTFNFNHCINRLEPAQVNQLMVACQNALQQILAISRQSWTEQQAMFRLGTEIAPTDFSQIMLRLNKSVQVNNLFCAPPVSGTSLVYQPLARALADSVSCYGLQLPDLYTDIRTESVTGLAAFYCALIKRIQPSGPYMLLGWSSGGTVAYEIARQLAQQGNDVGFLALLDQPMRRSGQQASLWQYNPYFKIQGLYGSKLVTDWEQVRHMPVEEALPLLVQQACSQGLKPADADERMMLKHFEALVGFPQVMDSYQAGSSAVPLTLFKAIDSQHTEPYLCWDQTCSGPITVVSVPGEHQNMVYAPFVDELAANIKQQLLVGGVKC